MEFGIQVDTKLVIQAYSIRELAGHSAAGIKQHRLELLSIYDSHAVQICCRRSQ